jgi:hypothetical protein
MAIDCGRQEDVYLYGGQLLVSTDTKLQRRV